MFEPWVVDVTRKRAGGSNSYRSITLFRRHLDRDHRLEAAQPAAGAAARAGLDDGDGVETAQLRHPRFVLEGAVELQRRAGKRQFIAENAVAAVHDKVDRAVIDNIGIAGLADGDAINALTLKGPELLGAVVPGCAAAECEKSGQHQGVVAHRRSPRTPAVCQRLRRCSMRGHGAFGN